RIPGTRRFPSLPCRATSGYGRRLLQLASRSPLLSQSTGRRCSLWSRTTVSSASRSLSEVDRLRTALTRRADFSPRATSRGQGERYFAHVTPQAGPVFDDLRR